MLYCQRVVLAALVALVTASGLRCVADTAAIVHAGLPGEDAQVVSLVSKQIEAAGYEVTELDANGLCDPAVLNASAFDLLVLPNAADLPMKSVETIGAFAKAGGDIIAFNAPLWQRVLIDIDGKWTTREDYQRDSASRLPSHVVFDYLDTSQWHRAANDMTSPSTYEVSEGPAPGQKAIHATISDFSGWDNFGVAGLRSPFPKDHALTVFSAKGDGRTSQLAVEWSERDGSRWIAVIPLYPEWRQYALTPKDFHYWTSVEGRGGAGDQFKPENAQGFSVGLAVSHTGGDSGKHEFWIGPVGTAQKMQDLGSVLGPFDLPGLDSLSPGYKLFDVHGHVTLSLRKDQAIVTKGSLSNVPADTIIRSPQPRPSGGGFDKRRDWRFIPIVEARSTKGEWRGDPVTMIVNADGPYKGGVWASFGFGGSDVYKTPAMLSIVRRVAERMRDGVFILDGGTNFYTYFVDQPAQVGLRIANLGKETRYVHAKVEHRLDGVDNWVGSWSWEVANLEPGEIRTVSSETKNGWTEKGSSIEASISEDAGVIDRVSHRVYEWKPKAKKSFITIKNGEFMLHGKRWRAHGVNYMPSSGIGTEDGEYFEHWIGARSYDPEVIDRDLDHIKAMGLNAVSVFVYMNYVKDMNMLDLLRRLEQRGLKANVGLRPGMPATFDADAMQNAIRQLRLAENDTVFAYDIAWEPMFGSNSERRVWDADWKQWIVERYGSVSNAEKDWGFAVPRTESGQVTNPLPNQIDTDGKWRVMTAAYRRFLDTMLYKKYGEARRVLRSVDPNHFVSFRMAEAGNPNFRWDGRIPYDFPYLAAAVDVLEPEAYGRVGDWEKVKPGWFELAYAKWAAPRKPALWAEMGVSTWELSRMMDTPQRMDFQAMFHEAFYKLITSSATDGIFFWWYPGGFRYGENSDYGIINPDGTDKPVTKVIRDNARKFIDGPSRKEPDYWITFDRDEHPDGIAGIYDAVKREFWDAIAKGRNPGLKTAGTGTDSSNCPLVAVGSVPLTGSNPAKYLDAAIDSVQIMDSSGKWIDVKKGGTLHAPAGKSIVARIEFTNLGEAKLLAGEPAKAGAVSLRVETASGSRLIPLKSDVDHLESAKTEQIELLSTTNATGSVAITFEAQNRTRFGERFSFTVTR